MPTLPKQSRTISQLISAQLPDFIQEGDPMFVAFLIAYYEWLESTGPQVWTGKVLATNVVSVILPPGAATYSNAYQNMYLVCLNGPAKGQTQKIQSYDPTTRIVTLVNSWNPSNIPPPNTRMEIRDQMSPEKLLEYRDIDFTLDRFVSYFKDQFLCGIPGNILADSRLILKNIKQFYQAKGTEDSFRFLFRIMFNEEVEFYYPKVDLFRVSDAVWSMQNVMKVTTTGPTFDYLNRQLIGVYSGATANIEAVTQQIIPQGTITTLTLSGITGNFVTDPNTGNSEQVKVIYPIVLPAQTDLGSIVDLQEPHNQLWYEQSYQILQSLSIQTPGNNYQVGEFITVDGGGSLLPAKAIITSVSQSYYNGMCSFPELSSQTQSGTSTIYNPTWKKQFGVSTICKSPTRMQFGKSAIRVTGTLITQSGVSEIRTHPTQMQIGKSAIQSAFTWSNYHVLLSSNEVSQDDFFVDDLLTVFDKTGLTESAIITAYNGTTKIATTSTPLSFVSTSYCITHARGGIQALQIVDFGLGFATTPTITILTEEGLDAVLLPILGIVATTSGSWLLGRIGGIGGFCATTDSFASSDKIIQDSYYWQDFSYDLRSAEPVDKYRDVVKQLLHPAGLIMFGTVVSTTKPKTEFFNLYTDPRKYQSGISKIQVTTSKTQIGVSRINTASQIIIGVSRIGNVVTTQQTTIGVSRIQVIAPLKTQVGVSRIRVTTSKTQVGVSRIRVTALKTQVGVSNIVTSAAFSNAFYSAAFYVLNGGASFTYFVDSINGDDSNSGLSTDLAWKTTSQADIVPLFGAQNIGYLYLGTWYLYRCVHMTMDQWLLPLNFITYPLSLLSTVWVWQTGVSRIGV